MRILYVHGSILNAAGTEAYMMNYYRNMDRTKIQIDFIVHGYEKGIYDDEISQLGGKIYHVPIKTKDFFGNLFSIYRICKSGNYKIMHSHMDAMSFIPLKIAEICGIPVRIAHSHNSAYQTNNKLKLVINQAVRKELPKVATNLFACSKLAGEWLYGKENSNRVSIIPNAIDIDKYQYNENIREKLRNQLGFKSSDIVIGHIGRFEYQKNHEYLIQIFEKLHSFNSNYKLLLIGEGNLKEIVAERLQKLHLINSVIFIDCCKNANEYYNVFDLFVFPSHYEGLSVVLVEAQCNGLSCIASKTTSIEANITGNITYLPIGDDDVNEWVDSIMSTSLIRNKDVVNRISANGYSIKEAAINLQNKYEELYRKANIYD